jgi:phosphoglycerate kinase
VPIVEGKIENDFRIKQSLPTVNFLREAGAKIIAISHIEGKGSSSLRPVFEYFKKLFPVTFVEKYPSVELTAAVSEMKDGEMVLLENLRNDPREKANDDVFSKELAALGDLYVDEAFSAAHRKHASIVGIPKFIPGFAGLLFKKEVENLSLAFNPPKPFLFVLGGAKFETKMPLVQKFIKSADTIFIGGALANDFFREHGFEVGRSVVSEGKLDLKEILASKKISLPLDVRVENSLGRLVKTPDQVGKEDSMWDAGPAAIVQLKELVSSSQFVLWNGPLGNYEIGFKEATEEFAKIIAESGIKSIVGGGDTVASIESLGLQDKFTFLSTAGGAMLDFLANETLPGIEALSRA